MFFGYCTFYFGAKPKYAVSACINGKWTVIKPADVVTVTVD